MSLALCWAIKTGEWLNQLKPIKLKKYGRLSKGVLRLGLDSLHSILIDLYLKPDEFLHSLQSIFVLYLDI